MPRWSKQELDAFYARTAPKNPPDREPEGAKPERSVRDDAHGETQGKAPHTGRFRLCITSFRHKLLDVDNLYGGAKYFIDACRYEGLVPDDNPQSVDLEVKQIQVADKKDEHTEIEIEQLP